MAIRGARAGIDVRMGCRLVIGLIKNMIAWVTGLADVGLSMASQCGISAIWRGNRICRCISRRWGDQKMRVRYNEVR